MVLPGSTNAQTYVYYDNQDTFDVDIDDLYSKFISPIDALRSHYNTQAANANQAATIQYQESRCHTFLRMLGLPVVAPDGTYYSPGYDPNLNMNASSLATNQAIATKVISQNNIGFLQAQATRETVPLKYSPVFGVAGLNATAISIGSIFLRSFADQFSDTATVLAFDQDQIQTNQARIDEITTFFATQISNIDITLLTSYHILKPFVVDPRVDSNMKPQASRIAAPFLSNRSQLKIFTGSQTPVVLQRPYIELVLTMILNNTNTAQLNNQHYVFQTISQIVDSNSTDQDLANLTGLLANLQSNPAQSASFSKLDKIIRALVRTLGTSIIGIEKIRGGAGVDGQINFQPVPNKLYGLEAGSQGGTILQPTNGDPNNGQIEADMLKVQAQLILDQFQLTAAAINGTADLGDFVFSGADDIVFDSVKNVKSSNQDQLTQLTDKRNHLGAQGLDFLKAIEIIMGEFSGIGLMDIIAIQAAMWVSSPSTLLSLIDKNAYNRAFVGPNKRQDLSLGSNSQSGDVLGALQEFESAVKSIYKLIDAYIQDYVYQKGNFVDIQP